MNFYQQPYYWGPPLPPQGFPQNFSYGENPNFPQDLSDQQSYIENILRLNLGKVATVYMSFEGSQWGSKIFKGVLKGAGKDHIILKDLQSETRYLLLMVYLSYVTFDENIEYDYPYRKKEE